MAEFVAFEGETSAGAIAEEIRAFIRSRYPDYEPADGDLDELAHLIYSRIASLQYDQLNVVLEAIFQNFGLKVANVPLIAATPAVAASTWQLSDKLGHTIKAGTQVKVAVDAEDSKGFVVVSDVAVPPGSTATAAGAVLLRATEPGTESNELTGPVALQDGLSWVIEPEGITLVEPTGGGVDEETEEEYRNRLTERLQLLSESLIVRRDLEIDACSYPNVDRALCIPAYNWSTSTANQPLVYTVIPLTDQGAAPGAPERTEIEAGQQAKMPSGVTVYVGTPTVTEVDIELGYTTLPGFDPATVGAAASAAINTYLSGPEWGRPTSGDRSSSGGFEVQSAVYRNELIALANSVTGLDRVVTLKLAKHGETLKVQESVALAGVAPIAKAKEVKVVAE